MREPRGTARRDASVPLLVVVLSVAESLAAGSGDLLPFLVGQCTAAALLVARRRRALLVAPAAMLVVVAMSRLGPAADELASPLLVMVLAPFSLGRWVSDLRGLAALVPVYLLTLVGVVRSDGQPTDVTDVVFIAVLVFPPYVFGRVMRTLEDRSARLAAQAEMLTRLQATVREDAAAAERARIARELHDVLAHSISAMVVQAAAGEELLGSDPARAAGVMRSVAETGRRALAETGRLLSLVRDVDGELGVEPDPGLDRLPELVEQFRRSGLEVALEVDGDVSDLPPGVDLSAYRIAQEALTNALKYASDRAVHLSVHRDAAGIVVRAENRGRPGPSSGSGLGLVGMAERVSVYGGALDHGFTRDGWFRLSAALPLDRASV